MIPCINLRVKEKLFTSCKIKNKIIYPPTITNTLKDWAGAGHRNYDKLKGLARGYRLYTVSYLQLAFENLNQFSFMSTLLLPPIKD